MVRRVSGNPIAIINCRFALSRDGVPWELNDQNPTARMSAIGRSQGGTALTLRSGWLRHQLNRRLTRRCSHSSRAGVGLRQRDVRVIAGAASRHKVLEIDGKTAEQADRLLR